MKKLLLSAAFAAVIATPAFAQSFTPEFGTANVNPPVASEQFQNRATSSYAYEPRQMTRFRHDSWRTRSYRQDPNVNAYQRRDEDY